MSNLRSFPALPLLFLVHFAECSLHEQGKVGIPHRNVTGQHHVNYDKEIGIVVHGLLLWASMGFLMPLGILTMRMSTTRDHHCRSHRILLYLHATLQVFSVLLATAAAVLSIRSFENAFNNVHQRIGLALYAAIYAQILIGFQRPKRGTKGRAVWYFSHWILGTMSSLMGTLNVYTGLDAYHKRTSRNVTLWVVVFTAQLCLMAILYLLQDKWEYVRKQGTNVVAATAGAPRIESHQINSSQKDAMDESARKSNALGTYFSRTNALDKLFQHT